MANYRIVAELDPSGVTAGSAKVKQDLRGVDTVAGATKRAMADTFNAPGLQASVGSLISRIGTLEGSMDKLVTASNRVASGLERTGQGGRAAGQGQASMEAATRRVLQAVDQEAAELMRLNQLMADAQMLMKNGAITSDQYGRVQQMVKKRTDELAEGVGNLHGKNGMARMGQMELTHSLRSTVDMLIMGQSPFMAFSLEAGRATQAVGYLAGGSSKFASFMMGTWGIALTAAVTVVGLLASKYFTASDDVATLTNELEKNAQKAHDTEVAQHIFGNTLEGVTDALRKNADALKALDDHQKTAARRALEEALQQKERLQRIRAETDALLTQAKAARERNLQVLGGVSTPEGKDFAAQNLAPAEDRIAAIQADLAKIDSDVANADQQIQDALSRRVVELSDQDPVESIRQHYAALIEAARKRALAEGTVSTELNKQVKLLATQRDAAIKAEQDSHRQHSDGVARFRTREQAIGIAGRELQRSGLGVSENEQFGGVHATHPGMGNVAHGRYAIDVNSGAGVVESNIPDLKSRFDALARRYQARGFRVLWNGQVYEANGNGPSGPIRHGDQHRDHMHVEAPQTIIGKPTQASTEEAELRGETAEERERKRLANVAEQQRDFVQGVVDEAAGRGQGNQSQTLASTIERKLADFRRRFDRDANPGERKTITEALTAADARETAKHFDEAYTQPMERLRALQGKVGVDRDILNAELDETTRLGRELTPVEKEQIENSIRQSDALQRQAQILAEIQQPLLDYQARLEALNALLARGEISQTNYNAQVAALGDTARRSIADMPGNDPNTGQSYADISKRSEEDARYAAELASFENNRQQLLNLGISYDALLEAAHRRHVQNMNAIDQARRTTAITAAQSISDSLLSIAENAAGKQSVIYKAMFVASKAFAIADSIVQIQAALAKALNAPFPENLVQFGIVAAAAASIVSNIAAVKMNLADGGFITGPGGPRDDRIPINASNGEFMVNARATAQHRPLLEAINNGTLNAHSRSASNDNRAMAAGRMGDSWQLNFGDVNVHMPPGVSPTDGEAVGRHVKDQLRGLVREELRDAARDGGSLTRTRASVMA